MEFQYKEMGTRIKVRRKELKIKQAELAELLKYQTIICPP